MARYDTDRRYRRDYDRTDDGYRRARTHRTDDRLGDVRDRLERNFEGYDQESGQDRWDYAGRGPVDDARNYGRDPGIRDREYGDGGRSGRRYADRDQSYLGRSPYYDRDDRSDEDYLEDRYDRDYNRDYVRDYGDHNGYRGRYERGPHSGVGPAGYTRSAERMTEQVNERLTDDGHVDASEISVSVEDGEVTLTGTVSSRRQKRRAEDVAESVRGVDDVHNRLTVRREEVVVDDAS